MSLSIHESMHRWKNNDLQVCSVVQHGAVCLAGSQCIFARLCKLAKALLFPATCHRRKHKRSAHNCGQRRKPRCIGRNRNGRSERQLHCRWLPNSKSRFQMSLRAAKRVTKHVLMSLLFFWLAKLETYQTVSAQKKIIIIIFNFVEFKVVEYTLKLGRVLKCHQLAVITR